MTLQLPGIRRISLDEYMAGVRPLPGESWWVDQCLWDIANTVEAAVRQAARAGASAVTLYWGIPRLSKWARVIEACKEARLIIVLCYDDFHREVHWRPS
jgi:hypothetical protein